MTEEKYVEVVTNSVDKMKLIHANPEEPSHAPVIVAALRTLADEIEDVANVYNMENKVKS